MKSDTPRTDAFEALAERPINWWDFARELERENARLQMELDASCNAEEMRQVRADNATLREQLENLVDAVNSEFPGGMNIGGRTGPALICAVNLLARKLDVAGIIEAQAHNHERPLQLD